MASAVSDTIGNQYVCNVCTKQTKQKHMQTVQGSNHTNDTETNPV